MIKERDYKYYYEQMIAHERRMHPRCKDCGGKK